MADDAQAREAGVWSTDSDYIDSNLRKVCYPGDMEYSP
jgi:staphylococcal nuclease domain-containing protein 1